MNKRRRFKAKARRYARFTVARDFSRWTGCTPSPRHITHLLKMLAGVSEDGR